MASMAKRRAVAAAALVVLAASGAGATTYYVSSASGNDLNLGTSPTAPFATLAKVNTLALQPGDIVRLFCGETWRADPLILTRSGSAAAPIVVDSWPAGCADKPLLSGAQPVAGFAPYAANVYVADLAAGANAPRFANGMNQLFRGGERLTLGRWPNLDGTPDGGYASVDAQPAPTRLVDAALPNVNWAGAVVHIKGIRWYMLNRDVVSSSAGTLDVTQDVQCWNGCAGWGYFLNNHLATLDAEGEWYYDDASRRLYVYTTQGRPADGALEASAVLAGAGSFLGGIILGRHLQEEISWVTITNLRIERWFDAGITTPTNLEADEDHDLVISGNDIRDCDATGLRLATWVWDAANNGNGPDGWRGGRNLTVQGNTIERCNAFGIDTFAHASSFTGNTIRDVARIANLGRAGMGCGTSGTNCTENGDAFRINFDPGSPAHTGQGNQLVGNRIERAGMQGVDVFGPSNTLRRNVIVTPCISKGDCGAIRTFGSGSLATTQVHDVVLQENVIRDVPGNTDGTAPAFRTPFGFGIYVDNYSRDVTVTGNTIVGATWVGILFQRSTGTVTLNTLYGNALSDWGSQLNLVGSETRVGGGGNILFALQPRRRTLHTEARANVSSSDLNHIFSPTEDAAIQSDDAGSPLTLAGWRAFSGFDGSSAPHFYNQAASAEPRSHVFINEGAAPASFPLGSGWVDLDQAPVGASVSVPAYGSRVLIAPPPAAGQALDLVVGQGHGPANGNEVKVLTGAAGATGVDILAYGAGAWGVNVGSGRIGATPAQIVTGPGPGAVFGPQVRAFDRAGAPLPKVNFFAYGTLKYGVQVATAALDADVYAEMMTGPGPGAVFGPHVRGWNFDASAVAAMSKVSYFAYATLKYGANVARAEVDGDAFDEILTGPGPGQVFGAQARGWNYDGAAIAAIAKVNFFPYTSRFGVAVAAGDVDMDGFDEIATAPGAGPANLPAYRGFDYDNAAVAPIALYDVTAPGGRLWGGDLALGDFGGNGTADLATAPGPDPAAAALVQVYRFDGWQQPGPSATPFATTYGATVAEGLLAY